MKKVLIVILLLVIALMGFFYAKNEKLPVGNNPQLADSLAKKMLVALNKPAWDSTNVIAWTFAGSHDFIWDKKNNIVQAKWDDKIAVLNLNEWSKGKAFDAGKEVTDEKLDVIRGKAWEMFVNDSFWLIAPFKAFDEGTTRTIAKTEDAREGLLVTYTSGGVTPGDSYLWILDENSVPTSYKMWTKIIPIGGVESTWSNWVTLKNGVKIAQNHKFGPIDAKIENLKVGNSLDEIGEKWAFSAK